MRKLFNILIILAFCGPPISLTHAQDSGSTYRIGYDDGRLTISAKKANLKSILTNVADEADILVKFQHNLRRQITIKLKSVPLKKALRRLLRGVNYAFVYEGSDISEVYVVPKSGTRSRSRNFVRSRQREDRIRASIATYQKRLEKLKNQMAQADETSHRGKIIMRRIRSTERSIERLYKRLQ
jgi:type II secretory pathway component GspD/PulD (secretin)